MPRPRKAPAAPALSPELSDALICAIVSRSQPYRKTLESLDSIPDGCKVAFDLRVAIKGILTKDHATEVRPTSELLSKAVIACLLSQLGLNKAQAKRALLKAVSKAEKIGSTVSQALIAADKDLLLAIDEVDEKLVARMPMNKRAGTVRVHGSTRFLKVDLVDQSPPKTE